VILAAAATAAVLGWLLFYAVPDSVAELLGVLLIVALVAVGVRVGGRLADRRYPNYDVAEVAVEGPISRDGGPGRLPGGSVGTSADDVVDRLRAADDEAVDALIVKLNTPGGEVLPSEDIRRAVEAFDGPTVAYATDVCASGGYWIATGCDEVWAREASVVGSIGVIGSSVNVADLADRLGVSYERFAAGKYKDAGMALKELTEDEREYLQGIIDDYYDDFVERVAAGRGMDPGAVRATEARVYLGEEARAVGLVDQLGTRDEVEDRLAELLGVGEVRVREFAPPRGVAARLRGGAERVAYAFGAGVASAFDPNDAADFRFRF
jgi:protease-4